MEDVFLPIVIVGMLFIGLPWLIFHYVTQWKRSGSLSIEDNPEGTVDPADLAGTADESDADVVYQPEHSEEDLKD